MPARNASRLPPSSSSSATNGRPPTSPISKIWMMLGCRCLATASASIRNRARSSGFARLPARIIFKRDEAAQALLVGLVDDPHAAMTKLRQDLVAVDRGKLRSSSRDGFDEPSVRFRAETSSSAPACRDPKTE